MSVAQNPGVALQAFARTLKLIYEAPRTTPELVGLTNANPTVVAARIRAAEQAGLIRREHFRTERGHRVYRFLWIA